MLVQPVSAAAEDAFVRRHARHISRLRLTRRDGGVELEGVVDSYYRKQLVLRDAVAVWGWPALRARITVRRPNSDARSGRSTDGTGRKVLLAAADPAVLEGCAAGLACRGYDVTAASTGLGCLESLRAGGYDMLVLVGSLPWGGSNGVLDVACAAGLRGRPWAIYVGDRTGLDGLPAAITGRLTHIAETTPTAEEVVARLITECERIGKSLSAPVGGLPPSDRPSPCG
jgi:CheY-like chemotaxis protein